MVRPGQSVKKMKLTRRCWDCKQIKDYLKDFCRNQWTCRPCHTKRQRAYRRTLRGFLDQKYTAMSKRVRGKDRNCIKTAMGLPILPRAEFIAWAYKQPVLEPMFTEYVNHQFDFKWCPTIDRINPKEGYLPENMQFLYQSANAKKHTQNWSVR